MYKQLCHIIYTPFGVYLNLMFLYFSSIGRGWDSQDKGQSGERDLFFPLSPKENTAPFISEIF